MILAGAGSVEELRWTTDGCLFDESLVTGVAMRWQSRSLNGSGHYSGGQVAVCSAGDPQFTAPQTPVMR